MRGPSITPFWIAFLMMLPSTRIVACSSGRSLLPSRSLPQRIAMGCNAGLGAGGCARVADVRRPRESASMRDALATSHDRESEHGGGAEDLNAGTARRNIERLLSASRGHSIVEDPSVHRTSCAESKRR